MLCPTTQKIDEDEITKAKKGGAVLLAWINSANEEVREIFRAPRSLYDEIAGDQSGWAALQETLTSGPFVDVGRFLLPETVATAV